jgi:hypothetical protein
MAPMRPEVEAEAAALEMLQRAALEMYGEDRSGEFLLQAGLGVAARALWRIGEEPLEPLEYEPLPAANG